MKNFQKTFIAWLAFATLFVTSFANAELVKTQPQTSLYEWNTQCDWGTFDQVMYAWSDGHEMIDTLTVTNPSFTSYLWQFRSDWATPDNYTWYSSYNVIPNAITIPSLVYYSQGKPHNVNTVVVMGTPSGSNWAKITSNIPSTYKRSDIAAQVVYHVYRIWYKYAEWEQEMKYLDYGNLWAATQIYKYGKTWSPNKQDDKECLNIHIWFCWDWILDNWTKNFSENIDSPLNGWEECDDWAANGTDASNCTASCTLKPVTPKVTPKCVSSYEGDLYNKNYPAALLNADKILCNPGEVTSFVGPVDPDRTYSWKCTWSEWTTPDDCNAKELWCWDGKVQKTYGEECDPNETNPNWGDKECSSSCKLSDKKIYDLALTKELAEEGKTYKPGDSIYYRITIYNQWDYVAKNIEITDYIPYGLILDDNKWTQEGGVAKRLITTAIQPWTSVSSITIKFKIDPNFNWTSIINGAEISKDNSDDYDTEDIDSNPDTNPNDDCIIPYEHITDWNGKAYSEEWKACDKTTDEDDHDYVPIYFEDEPGEPTIDKNLMWDKDHPYKVWELVGFKMVFKNTTNKAVIHAIIKDQLPLNLEYVSSEIYGVSSAKKGVYKVGGVTVLEYSWFDLAPNQEGYLIMTGKVLSEHLDSRVNNVCIYGNDQKNDDGSDKSYVCDNDKYIIWWRDIKIEKTVDKQEVALGDIVEYTITVTALDWEYTGYRITDTLPKGISFYSFDDKAVKCTTDYTYNYSTWKTKNWLDTIVWNYSFKKGFKKWDVLTVKFKAKITELYKTYSTNIACLLPPGEEEICDEVDVKPHVVLNIKKYVSNSANGPWYDTGMTLENGKNAYFKIVVDWADDPLEKFIVKDVLNDTELLFKNDSWSLANNAFTWTIKFWTYNTWVKDDYKITPRVNATTTWTTALSWDVYMWKGLFMSWDKFEAIFVAEKKADKKNIACVYYDKLGEEAHECDPAEVKNPTWNLLTIKKYVSKNSDWKVDGDFKDADTTSAAVELDTTTNQKNIIFKMVVKDAKVPFTGFTVKDSLDTSMYKLLKDATLKLDGNAYTWIMKKWAKNTTPFTYVITPKITNDKDLEWNVVMTTWSVFMEGDTFTVYFKAEKVRNDNDKNTACVYDYSGKTSYACDPAHVLRKCLTSCGSGPTWWGWGWWGGGWSSCWNGKKDWIEYCDWWGSEKSGINKGDSLFRDENIPNTYDGSWTCTRSCTLKKESWEAPQCFNVQNGSISIMKWEMLPFYWNLEWKLWTKTPAERANYYNNTFSMNCKKWEDDNKINLKDMKCHFVIYWPGRKAVYDFTTDCVTLDAWTDYKTNKNYKIINSFIEQNKNWWYGGSVLNENWDNKNVFKTLDDYWQEYPILFPASSKFIIKNFWERNPSIIWQAWVKWNSTQLPINAFWEYKISLQSVTYDTCWGWDPYENKDGAICEVDFAVTDHYIVQKSPYWEIKSQQLSNTTKYSELSDYMNIDGWKLFDDSNVDKVVDYSVPAGLQQSLQTFIKKYYGSSVVAIKKADSNCWVDVRKVQWKSIYFIDWTAQIDLSNCLGATDKVFTLIAKDWANIVIRGNLYTNAMIMTEWQIIFDAQWFKTSTSGPTTTACNGDLYSPTKRYWHAWQMVKWIFYAGKGFDSINDKKNTDLNNAEWCNYGNLHIKGVAIWDLKNVVKNRRSELYTWFNNWCDVKNAATDPKCKERRNIVINWASVLVEYNPDLWGNLPPGAEDFNKALEVYRK